MSKTPVHGMALPTFREALSTLVNQSGGLSPGEFRFCHIGDQCIPAQLDGKLPFLKG